MMLKLWLRLSRSLTGSRAFTRTHGDRDTIRTRPKPSRNWPKQGIDHRTLLGAEHTAKPISAEAGRAAFWCTGLATPTCSAAVALVSKRGGHRANRRPGD